jgi:ADP-ribose pyrophosphatase YjhB (NUDIX family)
MLKKALEVLWRRAPKSVRRLSISLLHPRFMVSAGAVVFDDSGRVLLLNHVFRTGSGWGIPGGFLARGEQPEDALRRELREEIGLEIESAEFVFARTIRAPAQVEIIFRCRLQKGASAPAPRSIEIKCIEWFTPNHLPRGLTSAQRRIINRVLSDKPNAPD